MTQMNLDYETYSDLDLFKVGGFEYAKHHSTEILFASYVNGWGEISLWDAKLNPEPPADLIAMLLDPSVEKHAFNAQFEYLITKYVLKIDVPIEQWRCTMMHAWSLSFSGGLGAIAIQLGFPTDRQKMAEGKKLINRFCKPAPRNHNATRYDMASHPEEWQRFGEYCIQDTFVERDMGHWLSPYPVPYAEQQLWFLDQHVNERGVPVDSLLIDQVIGLVAAEKRQLVSDLKQMTGVDNPMSGPQFMAWLQQCGMPQANVQKATLERLAGRTDTPQQVELVIRKRLQAGKTSNAKWDAYKAATSSEGRVCGMFQFAGAQRTKRWAGRIVQLHNLPQGRALTDAPALASVLEFMDLGDLHAQYQDVMSVLSALLRAAIKASPGNTLVVSDLGSIESRVLGYISGCVRINETFAQGRDTYKDYATELFKVPYDQVTKDQRNWSKPPTLGCGFQLGAEGLVKYADGMGVTMDLAAATTAVDTYRATYPEVPAMWRWLVGAVKDCILNNTTHTSYCVTIRRDDKFMFIDLPSGRSLAYFEPAVLPKVPPWEAEKVRKAADMGQVYTPKTQPTITYMGQNSFTNKWERLTTHGGKITENIVQAIARDVLSYHMWLVEHNTTMDLIGHVHDELITESVTGCAEDVTLLENIMSMSPPWCPDMLLDAEGYTSMRYKKG